MARVTLQVLEGLERGDVFRDVATPVTIGREEDNAIHLNDERISRFHAKIQEDGGRLILTDLDSTNGTRVNGVPVQMRVLRIGDQIGVGRCLLLVGSREQIAAAIQRRVDEGPLPPDRTVAAVGEAEVSAAAEEAEPHPGALFPDGRPDLPSDLRMLQQAELSDLLTYVHERIRQVLEGGREVADGEAPAPFEVDWASWQRLASLEMDLAEYLRQLADPDR